MTLYVGNLSFDAEQEDLRHLFSQYGEVRQCSLPLDRETGRKRGFAFVELVNEADEQKAIDDLQDVEWMGRRIRVNKAEPVATAAAVVAATAVVAAVAAAVAAAAMAVVAVVAAAAATKSQLLSADNYLSGSDPGDFLGPGKLRFFYG